MRSYWKLMAFVVPLAAMPSALGAEPPDPLSHASQAPPTRAPFFAATEDLKLRYDDAVGALAALDSVPNLASRPELSARAAAAAWFIGESASGDGGLQRAIPLLVTHVDWKGATSSWEFSRLRAFPCAVALRDIGPASIPYVLAYLEETPVAAVSDESIALFGHVILEMQRLSPSGSFEPTLELLRAIVTDVRRRSPAENLVRLLCYVEEEQARSQPKPRHPELSQGT